MNELGLFKDAATKLEVFLAAEGCAIKHTRILEGLAQALGARNYRTLKGLLGNDNQELPDVPPQSITIPNIGNEVLTVYLEASDRTLYGDGPSYAAIKITQAYLNTIAQVIETTEKHNIAFTVLWDEGMVTWENNDRHRMEATSLTVSADGSLWWSGTPKHTNNKTETYLVGWAELGDAIAHARSSNSSRIILGDNPDDLEDLLDEEDD